MTIPIASERHSGPTLLQSLMVDISRRPGVEAPFLQHLESSSIQAQVIHHASKSTETHEFVPISALQDYLTDAAIRRILVHYCLPASECERVRKHYLRIFTILVCIGEVIWLRQFLAIPSLSDKYLPFNHHQEWPSECLKFSTKFRKAQKYFCAQEFQIDQLNHTPVGEDVIIPFTSIHEIKKGVNSSTYKVVVHPDYNNLNRDNQGNTPTNTFFLKSCLEENAEYHYNEVEAYKSLRSQKDVIPYMAQFHGSWIQSGTYNMLLEYVGGGTLTEFMNGTETPTRVKDIVHIWRGLLNLSIPLMRIHLLHNMNGGHHCQGIHHDIKPDNILVTENSGVSRFDVKFKLVDLGLANFAHRLNQSGNLTNQDNRGTQMYSPPELCVDEDDMIIQKTVLDAQPSKDIWAFGCVLSEAATWIVLGKKALDRYRQDRSIATNKIPRLRGTSHTGCFHDGTKVLEKVLETHEEIRGGRRVNDPITETVLVLVEDMLGDAVFRPKAAQAWQRSNRAIKSAQSHFSSTPSNTTNNNNNDYQYPDIFDTSGSPNIDRTNPPELPPELKRGAGGLGLSPSTYSHIVDQNKLTTHMTSAASNYLENGTRYQKDRSSHNAGWTATPDTNCLNGVVQPRSEIAENVSLVSGSGNFQSRREQQHGITSQDVQSKSTQQKLPYGNGYTSASNFSQKPSPLPMHDRNMGNTASFVHNDDPKSPSLERRTKFPTATIEEVERWIKMVKSNPITTPLSGQDWLKPLNGRDQIFLFDDSGSMKEHWKDAIRVFRALGYLVKGKDPDGMEIRSTMDTSFKRRNKDRGPLLRALSTIKPEGECDIGRTLGQILRSLHPDNAPDTGRRSFPWTKQKWGVNIYILTDGVWELGDDWILRITEPIKKLIASGMQKGQLGIQFIQLGSDSLGTRRLQMLDDHLKYYGVNEDFIDTEHCTGNVFKMLLGSIDDAADSQKSRPLSMPSPQHTRHSSAISPAITSTLIPKEMRE